MKAKRMGLGMTLRAVGELAGISYVHIRDIESDRVKPSFEKIMRLAQAFKVDIQEFLKETGYLPQNTEPMPMGKLNQIPVISWVAAGQWQGALDEVQPRDAEEWVASDVKGQNIFALRVTGDSMEPEFVDGDILIVDPHAVTKPGDYVIVRNDEGEATFKQLKQYGDTQVLHPLNRKYPDIELSEEHEYVMVGKAVEKKKRY